MGIPPKLRKGLEVEVQAEAAEAAEEVQGVGDRRRRRRHPAAAMTAAATDEEDPGRQDRCGTQQLPAQGQLRRGLLPAGDVRGDSEALTSMPTQAPGRV